MRLVAILATLFVGCGQSSPRTGVDAAPGDTDAGADGAVETSCIEPDRECTAEHPHPGGPCEGELTCEYEDDIFFWTYRCESGAWTAEPRCGGGCPVPPLSELCLDPFQGTLEGAEVTIGPASFAEPFRAFEEAELVDPIWGPQGSAMIAFRLEVTGAGAPDCAAVDTGLEVEGSSAQHSLARVRLRCGASLGVFVEVQDSFHLCDAVDPLAAELDVEVGGIGTATAHLTLRAGGCPN